MTSLAIAESGRGGQVRFLGEIPSTAAALHRLVERLKARHRQLAVPVDITGTLHEPEVRLCTGTAVRQTLRGIVGRLLIPLNQLSALFGEETRRLPPGAAAG